MKKALITLLVSLTVLITATAVGAAMLSPGLDVIAEDFRMTVSALEGEEVSFTKEQFAEASGRDSFDTIKLTSLPDESDGTLYFGDVAAVSGQVVGCDVISKLRFEPAAESTSASFGFVFDDSYTMTCNVVYSAKNNSAPTVFDEQAISVFTSTACSGEMRAYDADGDAMRYEVVDYPDGGGLTFDSTTGKFTYTAGSRVMNDSFTYRVKDAMGEYSETCEFVISVRENTTDTVFSDMNESTSVTAAVAMTDAGYMSCTEEDGKLYFSPDSEVSRLDFLVSAMNVFGAAKIPEIKNTGFADDSDIPEKYKGYVYSAAKLGIVNGIVDGGELCFKPDDTITKEQASVILNSIIGYSAKTVTSVDGVPEWASEDVCAMYELGVYDIEDKSAANVALTKDNAAEMLYRVSCLIHE